MPKPKRAIPAIRRNMAKKSVPIIPAPMVSAAPDAGPAPVMPGGMKKGGKAKCMAEGGEVTPEVKKAPTPAPAPAPKEKPPANLGDVMQDRANKKAFEGGEKARKGAMGSVGFKAGGYVRAADGIAKKGKTRGKII